MLNIGQRIHDVVARRQYNITRLAADLCCDRKTVYRLFNKASIDSQLLFRISVILRHDFFEEYRNELSCHLDERSDCGNSATANER